MHEDPYAHGSPAPSSKIRRASHQTGQLEEEEGGAIEGRLLLVRGQAAREEVNGPDVEEGGFGVDEDGGGGLMRWNRGPITLGMGED